MDENTQGDIVPENETQDVATPTTEQQTTPEVTTQGDGLPDEASERTKTRFDELTNQLREERQRREALEGAFKTLQPKQSDQVQPFELSPIYNPDTGYLNEDALAQRDRLLLEARQQQQEIAQQLSQERAQRASELQEREAMEAYSAHPELNPDAKTFDKNLHAVTSSLMLRSMVHPEEFGNKQLSFKDAGDQAKSMIRQIADGARTEGAKQAMEQLTPKEQATLEATGTPARRGDIATNLDTLRFQTRRGNQDAIVQRLQGLKTQA